MNNFLRVLLGVVVLASVSGSYYLATWLSYSWEIEQDCRIDEESGGYDQLVERGFRYHAIRREEECKARHLGQKKRLREQVVFPSSPSAGRKLGCVVYFYVGYYDNEDLDNALLRQSLDSLYVNYIAKFPHDVLVFTSVSVGELPAWVSVIHVDDTLLQPVSFIDRKFFTPRKNMERFFAGLLYPLLEERYEYMMRMDVGSILLSKIDYNLFQFMQEHHYVFGFRVNEFGRQSTNFRKMYTKILINKRKRGSGFIEACCLGEDKLYNSYGYHNKLFLTKTSFWTSAQVQNVFDILDWSGGIYLYEETSTMIQSVLVQLFLPKSKVHKFTDWSYQYRHEKDGFIVRGTKDFAPFQRQQQVIDRGSISFKGENGLWIASYQNLDTLRADYYINFHGRDDDIQLIRPTSSFCTANRNVTLENASKELQQLLLRTTECSDDKQALLIEEPECGAGCTINYMIKPLIHAIQTNQALLTPKSRWADPSKCGGNKLISCFLRRFATCREKKYHGESVVDGVWRTIGQDDIGPNSGLVNMVPGFEQYGLFWNVGQILKFIMEPSPHIQRLLHKVLVQCNFNENRPILGLHVRLGDSCYDPQMETKGRRCDGLDYYMPTVTRLVAKYGYKSIYLATDSSVVLENATSQYPQFNWIYNANIDREKYKVFSDPSSTLTIEGVLFGDKTLRNAGFSRYSEMANFLVDLLIMGQYADGFVGKFTSNMDRIVAALSAATGNDAGSCSKPTVSLDSHWCFDFNILSGKTFNNRSFYC